MTVAQLIAKMVKFREAKAELAKKSKLITAQEAIVEKQMMDMMKAQGTDIARNPLIGYTASIIEEDYPNIEDWDTLSHFILRNKALYLLPRRVLSAAWRDLKLSRRGNKEIPGVKSFKKQTLSIKKTTARKA